MKRDARRDENKIKEKKIFLRNSIHKKILFFRLLRVPPPHVIFFSLSLSLTRQTEEEKLIKIVMARSSDIRTRSFFGFFALFAFLTRTKVDWRQKKLARIFA